MEPKGPNLSHKGTKTSPKGSNLSHGGTKMSPKGAKRIPKVSPKSTKIRRPSVRRVRPPSRRDSGGRFTSPLPPSALGVVTVRPPNPRRVSLKRAWRKQNPRRVSLNGKNDCGAKCKVFFSYILNALKNWPKPLGGCRLKAPQAIVSTTCGGGAFNARKVSFKGPFEVIMLVRCRLNGRLVPKCL